MEEVKDRRSLDRLNIPESTALLLEQKWFKLMNNYLSFVIPTDKTKSKIIIDISKSGACFISRQKHEYGDLVNMVVSIPGEKNIRLKGHVRWARKHDDQLHYCIGAQFYAYGSGKKLNPMRSLEQLRYIHQRDTLLFDHI